MKTIQSIRKIPAVIAVALFALACLFQPTEASAKDGWKHNRGHENRVYRSSPGTYNHYNRSRGYAYNRGWNNQPRYIYHEGHRGYWENRSGLQFFINLD